MEAKGRDHRSGLFAGCTTTQPLRMQTVTDGAPCWVRCNTGDTYQLAHRIISAVATSLKSHKTSRYCWSTPKCRNWLSNMLSLKAKKLIKFPQEKVLLELCRGLANSIRPLNETSAGSIFASLVHGVRRARALVRPQAVCLTVPCLAVRNPAPECRWTS